MKRLTVSLLAVVIFIVLSGCTNTGKKFNTADIVYVPEDKALVYFYRPFQFGGGGMGCKVIINNMEIGTIYNNTYFKKMLPSGTYKIHSRTINVIDRISTFAFSPGKTYFVKTFFDMGMWISSIRFTLVPKTIALTEISKTRILLDFTE